MGCIDGCNEDALGGTDGFIVGCGYGAIEFDSLDGTDGIIEGSRDCHCDGSFVGCCDGEKESEDGAGNDIEGIPDEIGCNDGCDEGY